MAIKKLDVVTQVCPFPLIEAKAALAEMASGDELVIEFDCTQATEAIPQWAAEERHAITDYQQIGDAAWSITVQKA
ncbi:sulfurtransferase TusA family protein [Escherichia coli]|nr:sulfurtransferase TusA family protein [Escherichia coli]